MKLLKISFFVISVICIGLFLNSCSKTIYKSYWQVLPEKHDCAFMLNDSNGIYPPLSQTLRFFDTKSKLQYAFYNDAKNLYFVFRTTDEQAQVKIIRGGMELWIDTTGRDRNLTGFSYPLASDQMNKRIKPPVDKQANGSPSFSPNERKLRARKYLISQCNQMLLQGFKSPIGGMSLLKNDYGISVCLDIIPNSSFNPKDTTLTLIYEAVIPFSTFYKPLITVSDTNKRFSINIKINGIQMDGIFPGGPPPGGPPPMMRGAMPGSLPSGGPFPMRPALMNFSNLGETNLIKFNFKLSYK
ncbi:MAG: hypothetical protein KA792_09100 [Bacteroidales bacterium]|nr:hypothetical protein [Bacteroidales bacterium]